MIPTSEKLLLPEIVQSARTSIIEKRKKAKHYYDQSAKDLPNLQPGEMLQVKPVHPHDKYDSGSGEHALDKSLQDHMKLKLMAESTEETVSTSGPPWNLTWRRIPLHHLSNLR